MAIASFEKARLLLARLSVDEPGRERGVLERATRISAHTLDVARVGVWLLVDEHQTLRCELLHSKDAEPHETLDLQRVSSPAYFDALRQRRVIAAGDAVHDELTRELADSYLIPQGVGAMLDAPLYVGGELIGVVCHEHVGSARTWTPSQIDFAASVADIVSALYTERRLRAAEAAARESASARLDADRLDGLRHLTSAVAHDINNALTVAGLVGRRISLSSETVLVQMGSELIQVADFAARILRELKTFAMRPGDDRAPIGEILDTFRVVLEALVRTSATLAIENEAPDAVPALSRTHVEQILMNLCVNARDAVGRSGAITIRITREGERVVLRVSDNGPGIDPAILDTLWDPYVTTKPHGSGLGLAIVRGLAVDHGGTVAVESTPGSGSTFTVELPVVEGRPGEYGGRTGPTPGSEG